jgi:Domain of unknown function (DUF4124)
VRRTILLFALIAAAAQGQTVYKSVNADGTITYSDEPVENSARVEILDLKNSSDTEQASAESAARIEQMSQVSDRLKQDRLARDKIRQAQEELALARQQLAPPLIYREEYYRSHYPYRGRHHYRPRPPNHYKPRPTPHSGDHLNNKSVLVPKSKLLTPMSTR